MLRRQQTPPHHHHGRRQQRLCKVVLLIIIVVVGFGCLCLPFLLISLDPFSSKTLDLKRHEASVVNYAESLSSKGGSKSKSNGPTDDNRSVNATTASQMNQVRHDSQNPKEQMNVQRRITVFYHMFANPNKKLPSKQNQNVGGARSVLTKEQTMGIVQEQLHQIAHAASLFRNQSDYNHHWELRFASVGEEGVINSTWIKDSFCHEHDLECHSLGHVREGHEEVTLQHLYNFCVDHPDQTVIYVHTKGTFHAHVDNHKWRHFLTSAVLKPACLFALLHEQQQCNVCGLQFYPMWIPMFPGNFFAAQCSYIQHLLPVAEHDSKMSQLIQAIQVGRNEPNKLWSTLVYKWQRDVLGADRWSREAWVASHPQLVPCDMAGNLTQLFLTVPESQGMEHIAQQQHASRAPRVDIFQGDWYRRNWKGLIRATHNNNQPTDTQSCSLRRPHEYFLLPGLLYRYHFLYGQFPPHDSWVWQWFPCGMSWRAKVQEAIKQQQDGKGWNDTWLW